MRVIGETPEVWRTIRENAAALKRGGGGIVEIPLDDEWVILAFVGHSEGRQPWAVRAALVVPRGDVPEGGLRASTLRKPSGIADAPAAFLAHQMRASAADAGVAEEDLDWWHDETFKAHQRAYRRKPPRPGDPVTEQQLADFALDYIKAAKKDRRGIYRRMRRLRRYQPYSETYLRDRINDATEAGLLPPRHRGQVATEPTEKLLQLLSERGKK